MKRLAIILAACVVLTLSLCLAGCTSPTPTPAVTPTPEPGNYTVTMGVTITDSNGKTVTLPKTAERIIVTNSDSAEVMIALGAIDKIVGVPNNVKNNPNLAGYFNNTASIGEWTSPNMESIVALRPDVVIAYAYAKPKNMDQFSQANITVLLLDCYKMDNITSDIRKMGILTGKMDRAEAYAGFMEPQIALVKERTANLTDSQKPTVFWESNMYKLSTVVNGSGGDTLIRLAGGKNIAGNLTSGDISNEWVIERNPDIVIKVGLNYATKANMTETRSTIMNRTGMPNVKAVKDGKVYVISSTLTFGPKGFIGLLEVARIIHPELFSDIDPAKVMEQYDSQFVPGAKNGNFVVP